MQNNRRGVWKKDIRCTMLVVEVQLIEQSQIDAVDSREEVE